MRPRPFRCFKCISADGKIFSVTIKITLTDNYHKYSRTLHAMSRKSRVAYFCGYYITHGITDDMADLVVDSTNDKQRNNDND